MQKNNVNLAEEEICIRQGRLHKFRIRLSRQKYLFLMLAPAFLALILFNYLPLSGWYMAFSDYKLGKPLFGADFVGLKYFVKIFQDSSDFVYLIRNTVVMNLLTFIILPIISVTLALLLREVRWKGGAKAVQTIMFFPYFLSWVIVYSICNSLLSVNTGSVNQFLVGSGILKSGINILGDPKYSWGLIVGVNLWVFVGYNCIIYLSTIAGIPKEQYEAAAIDGAGRFQQAIYVTLPNMMETIAVLFIMDTGYVLSSNLEQFFIFQNATNWQKMEVLDMYIYKFGFKMLDFPYATAMGLVKTLVGILFLILVNFIVKKINGKALL